MDFFRSLLGDRPPSLDRNDGSSPRSAPAAPDAPFEIENLRAGAEHEPQQGIRPQQGDAMAGGAIDLHDIAAPEVFDPR
jgi:hypothetical protein